MAPNLASSDHPRGQLVLVAAVVVAVALVPIVLATLQLGYHADVRASEADGDPTADATATLTRSLHAATEGVPREYDWGERRDAVDAVERRLAPRIETVERARLDTGTARSIQYNDTAAQQWAATACPGGPGRQFGPCEAIGGVVVQRRANETHVLGIAVDLRVTGERQRTDATVRISTTAGRSGRP